MSTELHARAGSPSAVVQRALEPFDVERIRKDFPILSRTVHGKPLVYLDSAATSQKPRAVAEAMSEYLLEGNANVHRGVHWLSEHATQLFEGAREKTRQFMNAPQAHEIIFVRGSTEGINLVASTFGRMRVKAGDEVLITTLEHHSNIVPWQMLCDEKGATLRVVPVNDAGELDLDALESLLGPKTRLLAVAHVSNALGTINPVKQIIQRAHAKGVPVLVDGAQAAPHMRVDVQALDCDFYVLSAHKMFGPTGVGVLFGKTEHLEAMPPYQGGGDMILSVTFEKTIFNRLPYKFEAGTPDIAGVISFGAAIDYVNAIGIDAITAYEGKLLEHGTRVLSNVPGLRMVGTAQDKAAVFSFVLEDIHPHDIGTVLDNEGIAIRTGHHCAQPLMIRFGVPATARASLALYNTTQELDQLAAALLKVKELFQ